MFHAASSPGPKRTPLPAARPPTPDAPRPQRPDTRRGPSGEQRDPFFDNAKYLAIVLVGLGHAWANIMSDNRLLQTAYTVVYVFHMPAFIIISGYFSRTFDLRPHRLKRLLTGVLVPYLVFQTAYSLFRIHVGHTGDPHINLFVPWYLTWFLCALFVWRLTAPVWRMLRRPLPVALAVAMLASVTPGMGGLLDMQRILQFAPCFVLGMCLKPEHFHLVRRRAARIASVPVFVLTVAAAWWATPGLQISWLYRNAAAQDLGAPWWAGPVTVLVLFACAVLLTACFLAWVPGRRLWCTALGAGTLGGYLLHGFVVKGVLYAGGFEPDWMHGPLGALVVTVVAAAGVTLLCTPAVLRVFRWVMEPRMDWAFRPVAPRTAGESGGTDGRAAVSGQAGTAGTAGAGTSEKAGAATGR